MIKITLEFATIEEATAYLTSKKPEAPAKPEPVKNAKPTAEKTAAPAPSPTPAPVPAEPTAEASSVLDYAVLQKAVFSLVGKKTGAAMTPVLTHFGVKHMKDLAADRRQEALDMINGILAE